MWAKAIQWAPVIFTTAAAGGLFVIHVDDPKTQKLIRAMALFMALGSVFAIVKELPSVTAAISDVAANWRKEQEQAAAQNAMIAKAKADAEMQRIEQEKQLAIVRRDAEIALIKAKADAEAAVAKRQADAIAAQQRAEQRKIDDAAQLKEAERRARDKERDDIIARRRWEADQDAQRRTVVDRQEGARIRREGCLDCQSQNNNQFMAKRDCRQICN